MLGKIVQLRGILSKDSFEVKYGINVRKDGTADLEFATIQLYNMESEEVNSPYICGTITVNETKGLKYIFLKSIEEKYIKEDDIEDYLFVIIPYASVIETTACKIAGRYPKEAILKMYSGETVKVKKVGAKPETYMAVQAGNEMFLIKKNR